MEIDEIQENGLPFITIVMPVYNEEDFIRDTLENLQNQDYSSKCFEVIVADGLSSDRTREVVRKISSHFPQLTLVSNVDGLSSSGRNLGFRKGKGDIFLVIDGHCFINNNQLLKNIVQCFKKSGADCLGRPQPLDPPGLSDFQKAVALARASSLGHSGSSFIYRDYEGFINPTSNGAIYKREVFEKIGYVDESFDACEDVEFNYRVEKAGFKSYMSPSLTIKYYPRESFCAFFNQMVRYGKGRFLFVKKHPETMSVNTLVPPGFFFGLFAPLFLKAFSAPLSGGLLSVWFFLYGIYITLILFESGRISAKQGVRYFCYLPPIFFTIHFGLGFGFLLKLMQKTLLRLRSSLYFFSRSKDY